MFGKSEIIRMPVVAGSFYPAEKNALMRQIKGFLQKAPKLKVKGLLRILIVPHAGYEYSGQTAAWGFAQLKNKHYSTVVLLGPSHGAYFSGAVVDESDSWQTPLGKVGVDKNLARKIVSMVDGVSFSSFAHLQEHSLEVELPFLQAMLSNFKIVPVLLGETNKNLLDNLAEFLSEKAIGEALIVVSSDLSHYPTYDLANEVDKKTIDSILSGRPENFEATISIQMRSAYPNLVTCACGGKVVDMGLRLAQKLGSGKWRLFQYINSGDVTKEKGRVVGYAAIGYYKNSEFKIQNSKLGLEAQKKLLEIARKTLNDYLAKGEIPKFKIEDVRLNEKRGVFVTIKKDGQLRGCIGQIEPLNEPLWRAVQRMVIEAALKDPRFSPVRLNELDKIKIEISVLSKPQKIDDPNEIQLGRHGVIVKKGIRRGVFLPQVAGETNWDLETFMGQLCFQKAGLPWDCWKKKGVEIFIFTAQVFSEAEIKKAI